MTPCRVSSFKTDSPYLKLMNSVLVLADRCVLKPSQSVLDGSVDSFRITVQKISTTQSHRNLSRAFDYRDKQSIARVVIERPGHCFGICLSYCCFDFRFHMGRDFHLSSYNGAARTIILTCVNSDSYLSRADP